MMRVLAPVVKRLVVRVQPYVLEVERDVIKSMDLYSKIGVYGIVIEGMKYKTKRKDTVRFEGDNVINFDMLKSSLNRVKSAAHEAGLVHIINELR